jgi:nucleoid-associated protein YgaU
MIRALKGTFTLVALVTLGCFLRWATAGSITGLRTYDLDSLTVAAVSTVAWFAYVWLTLAVVLTALEQLPGVLGTLSGALAHRITTRTARTLLRTALGAAALTPLALPPAQATSATPVLHLSGVQQPPGPTPSDADELARFRSIEPGSQLHLSGTAATPSATSRETPPAQMQVVPPGRPTGKVRDDPRNRPPRHDRVDPRDGSTGGVRVGVPDRPTDGAPTRSTRLRPSAPTVVVREGDSLWRIAARELGPNATAESIAAHCQAWYSANSQVIGENPDLIFAGQVLRVPPAHGHPHPPGALPGTPPGGPPGAAPGTPPEAVR